MNKNQPLREATYIDTLDEPPYGSGPAGRRLEQGERIGRYTIIKWLGDGGMASVYLAQDASSQRVALKIIADINEATLARVEREARVQTQLKHPHIVPVSRLFEHQNTWVMVMEYIPGGSLTEWLETSPAFEQRLKVFEQICHATAYAHQHGVVHRDLKPSNILFRDKQSPPHALVTDFGIAKNLQNHTNTLHTRTGVILGTPGYMAPEQFQSGQPVDQRADIYALGVILYEFCCDVRPFTGQDIFEIAAQCKKGLYIHPSKHDPTLDPHYIQIIETCLKIDPQQRYDGVDELLYALSKAQGTSDDSPAHWPLVTRITMGTSVVTVAMMVIMAISWPRRDQTPPETPQVDTNRLLAQAHIDKLTARAYQNSQHHPAQALALWRTIAHLQQKLHGKTSIDLAHFEALRWRGGASFVLPQDAQVWRSHWSKDGQSLYIITIDGKLIHQNALTGEVLHTTTLFDNTRVHTVMMTSDRRYIFVVANSEYNNAHPPVHIYDTVTHRVIHNIPSSKYIAPTASLVPDTYHALLSNISQQIQLWDIAQKTMLKHFREFGALEDSIIECMAISDDQRQVAIVQRPTVVQLSKDGKSKTYTLPFGNVVQCSTRFSKDGTQLAIASKSGGVLLDLKTDQITHYPKHTGRAIIDLGDATLHYDGHAFISRIPWTGKQAPLQYRGHRGNITDIVQDEHLVYSSATDRTIRAWSKDAPEAQRVLYGHRSWIFDLDLHKAQNKLVSSSRDHTVRIFNNLKTHQTWVSLDKSVVQWIWSDDGQTLYGRTQDHQLIKLNRQDGFKQTTIAQLTQPIYHMQLSQDMLIVSTQDKRMLGFKDQQKHLDVALKYGTNANTHYFTQTQKLVTSGANQWHFESLGAQRFDGVTTTPQFITRAFVSKDESITFLTSNKNITAVVEPATQLEWHMTHQRDQPANIQTTPDGRYAAVGFWSGGVEIWDLKTKKHIKTLIPKQGSITHLLMTKDHLLAGGTDGQVWLWSVPDFKHIKTLKTHHGGILALAIDPTNTWIATTARDQQIHVFSIDSTETPHHHVFHTPSMVRHLRFHKQDRTLSAITADQNLWSWTLSTTNTTSDLLKQTGRWTNLRTCQHSDNIIPVVPFPSPSTIYAPEHLCRP